MLYRLKLYLRSLFLHLRGSMKKRGYPLLGLAVVLAACGSPTDHRGKTPLVEVDGNFLYAEDVKPLMPVGLSKKDSTTFMDNYLRNWVEDRLLYEKAENNVPDMERIEELVQSYRRSLIMHSYQQNLVAQELTDELSEVDLRDFYEKNRTLFKTDETLLKGLFIKVPLTAKDLSRIRRWYRQKDEKSIDHLEKYSLGHAADYQYFYDHWMPASAILGKLPQKFKDAESYLRRNRDVELKDTAYYYFLHVDELLQRGEVKPFEAARDEVKSALGTLRQADFMRKVRTDLYQRAVDNDEIKYYYNKDQ